MNGEIGNGEVGYGEKRHGEVRYGETGFGESGANRVSSFHEKLELFAKVRLCNEKFGKVEKSWEKLTSQYIKDFNCILAI